MKAALLVFGVPSMTSHLEAQVLRKFDRRSRHITQSAGAMRIGGSLFLAVRVDYGVKLVVDMAGKPCGLRDTDNFEGSVALVVIDQVFRPCVGGTDGASR